MFIYAVKSSKKKLAVIAGGVAVLIAVLILILIRAGSAPSAANPGDISIRAENEQERIAFLSQYGWDVREEPVKVEEVLIPNEFDDVYTNYNEIQLKQGFDLNPYKGCRAKRWTYTILNYPDSDGIQPTDGSVRANLLIYDGVVIGGDVCSVALDGFMHGSEPDSSVSASPEA